MSRLAGKRIEVELTVRLANVKGLSGDEICFHLYTATDDKITGCSAIVMAKARTLNMHVIGVDSVGISLDVQGRAPVNERLESTALGVWAVVDCADSLPVIHLAFHDLRVQAATLVGLAYTVLHDTAYTRPTVVEGLTLLFANVPALPSVTH